MFKMKKTALLLFLFGITLSVLAADIRYNSKPEEFLIYNRRNSKIYTYFILKPAESISCELINIDTLNIYSRSIINSGSLVDNVAKIVMG